MMGANYRIKQRGGMPMNAVGIDVSKGKSMIAVMRPFEMDPFVKTPFFDLLVGDPRSFS